MGIVYFYGGIAKFEMDWLDGSTTTALFKIANHGTFLEHIIDWPGVDLFYAWSGMLFDLLIPFLMLWKPVRFYAFLSAVLFHTNNIFVFSIGIFPVMALALTLLYFDPDFPRKMLPQKMRLNLKVWYRARVSLFNQCPSVSPGVQKIILIYAVWQIVFPFRHWFYPGNTNWHQDGHLFAWRMMLQQKNVEMLFEVTHPETRETRYAPLDDYLNIPQVNQLARNPDMVLQFAHYLRDLVQTNAGFDPIVTADIKVGLNGRTPVPLTDPKQDLGKLETFEDAYRWVKPLER